MLYTELSTDFVDKKAKRGIRKKIKTQVFSIGYGNIKASRAIWLNINLKSYSQFKLDPLARNHD